MFDDILNIQPTGPNESDEANLNSIEVKKSRDEIIQDMEKELQEFVTNGIFSPYADTDLLFYLAKRMRSGLDKLKENSCYSMEGKEKLEEVNYIIDYLTGLPKVYNIFGQKTNLKITHNSMGDIVSWEYEPV
jgi:hypothetical protein